MSETSKRVLAALARPPYGPHGPNGSWDTSAGILAREVERLERKLAEVRALCERADAMGYVERGELDQSILAILDDKGET